VEAYRTRAGGGGGGAPGAAAQAVEYRPTYRAVLAKRGFLVKGTLGSGSYSKVKMAQCLNKCLPLDRVAVKIIDRSKAPQDFQEKFLPRELEIWPRLSHCNIVRMIDYFQDESRVFMILEYCERGDALRYIQKSGALAEAVGRIWVHQVFRILICYLILAHSFSLSAACVHCALVSLPAVSLAASWKCRAVVAG